LHVLAVVNYLIWPQSSSRSIFDNKNFQYFFIMGV
jgi:hypothetical protein